MSVTVNEAGTYWIHVYGYSEDISGYYYLESFGDAVEYADQFEPNNTWEQSTDIDWNLEQEHAFAMGDNKDVFVFELDRTTEVVFYTQSDMDTYMDIYDENGEYITGDDDGGKDSNARIETDLDRGLYYLEVMPYEENVSGNYSLSAKKE